MTPISRYALSADARELAFTGKDIDADRASRVGRVNDVLPTDDALHEAARATFREIAQSPPYAPSFAPRRLRATTSMHAM